ncbi:MAG: TsoY family (seleno)protein [Gemmobacter sp.]|uniref:TsoY family (seleno)protein n=1 Tax=Gemmobacter sp. TaxID=1898957 RepID=UPI00391CC98F
MSNPTRPADTWAPLYFLSSVGAGGLAVTFFMWLFHWIPHPGQTVPTFEDIARAFSGGDALKQAMIVGALGGIAVFAYLNIKLFVWNLARMNRWSGTEAAAKLRASNAETQLAALPLAIAMTINVGFILGLVFVPGLWSVVEYLFPLAIAAFLAAGVLGLKQLGRFFGRVLGKGGFNCAANNSFGQVLPAFALAMVAVGLSAPAALSTVPLTSGVALVLSTFFGTAAVLLALVGVVLGVRSMLENGANIETAPTIMIIIPMMTVLGIMVLRQTHAIDTHFGGHVAAGDMLKMLTQMLSVQVLFGLLGLAVLGSLGYARRFLTGPEASVGSYALVCPGVALSVMLHFWLNKGLVGAGLVAKFGLAYWAISAVAVAFQVAMIVLVVVLNRRHFGTPRAAQAVPAE